MKTISHENQVGQTGNRIRNVLFSVIMGIAPAAAPVAVGADDGFRNDALLDPSHSLLKTEPRGRVTIYAGLENEVTEPALDKPLERIESMMFTSSRQTQPNDDVIVEDDDEC